MSEESRRLADRLVAEGLVQSEGRFTLAERFAMPRAGALSDASLYLLKLAQHSVASGARRLLLEGSGYATTFMHDGVSMGADALVDLLMGRLPARDSRASRALVALADAIDTALTHGASVELNVRHDETVIRVVMREGTCEIEPRAGGRIAAHWSMRVMVKGMQVDKRRAVEAVRQRCRHAPAMVIIDEKLANATTFGGSPLGLTDVVRGRFVTCLLPMPHGLGLYARDRHVVELRWLPTEPDAGGICLPQPAMGCLSLERVWDEQTWPLVDDPALNRSDVERNRVRRSYVIPTGDENPLRIGVYRGVTALRPRDDGPARLTLVMDGVIVREEVLTDAVSGVDAIMAVDALDLERATMAVREDGAFEEALGTIRERVGLLERVLAYEFVGDARPARVAHALSGRAGARLLGG
ncbi:MAG: hypothetical protein EB084_21380 [Proteobacteria bacterium]|nr:hypothetical protein [Pseudomonadota bacterium]